MKVKLFCLPYAGGSSAIYYSWKKHLVPEIELVPLELAGRGSRIHETLYNDRAEAVEDVLRLIKGDIHTSPYLLFGHSMGALISYELVQRIRESNLPPPMHIFFSGTSAPHLKDEEKKYHLMDEEDFKQQVLELGGTPPEFFESPELLELFLPLLKNDFRLAETDIPRGEINPLDQNITVFQGKEDDLSTQQCEEWRRHTHGRCRLHYFEGGHFFLNEETEQITRIINEICSNYLFSQSLSG